jgi:hypothetical protein
MFNSKAQELLGPPTRFVAAALDPSTRHRPLLTVNFRQPSYEFTFNVGIGLLF